MASFLKRVFYTFTAGCCLFMFSQIYFSQSETYWFTGRGIDHSQKSFHGRTRNFASKSKQKMEFVKNTMFINKTVNNRDTFNYVYSNSDLCSQGISNNKNVFLLVMISIAPGEIERRKAIRATWANVTHVAGKRVVTIFLLGYSTNKAIERHVARENELFHDIVKKAFLDSYRNLIFKTMMGLRWVNSFCNQTKFILRIDSDVIPSIWNLVRHLETLADQMVFEGFVNSGSQVVRDKRNKWFVPQELYPNPTYPPYMRGAAYVLSGNVVNPAVRVSQNIQFISVDDAYVGLLMKTIGISPKHERRYTTRRMSKFNSDNKKLCFFSQAFTVERESDEQLLTFWKLWGHFDPHQCSIFLHFYTMLQMIL